MRDIGVMTRVVVPQDELLKLLDVYAAKKAQSITHASSESVIGAGREVLYVSNLPPADNAYYDDGERRRIESKLGAPIKGYVSIHLGPGELVVPLAIELADEIGSRWLGVVDYGGIGGALDVLPPTAECD